MCIADLDERTRPAIEELQGANTAHYPTITFAVERSPEDPSSIHLVAVADVDDPDEVGDLIVERVVHLQVAGIPMHVIPIRTPEREQAVLDAKRRRTAARSDRAVRQIG